MAYWIRKAGQVIGPLAKEDVEARLCSRALGSLDEVSTDRATWTKLWKSEFWNRPKPAPAKTEPAIRRGFVHPRSRLSPEQLRASTPPPVSAPASPSPFADAAAIAIHEVATPPPLPSVGEPRHWALPTLEEEQSLGRSEPSDEQKNTIAVAPSFSIWRVLFGGVFHRHSESELTAILNGKSRMPENGEALKTWLWSRVFLVSVILFVVLLFLAAANTNALPGFFLVAAFGTPMAALVFFQECNVSGRVSAWKTISVFLIGGVLSILVTQLFNETNFARMTYEAMDAAGAGAIEEPAKALILLWFVARGKRYPFILDGLLLGAAVGAGFAAFETAGYIFNGFMEGIFFGDIGVGFGIMTETAVIRGALAPFMHIAWTAAIGGALWSSRGLSGDLSAALFSWQTVGVFILSVGLHTLWNAGLSGSWLAMIAWFPLIHYLRRGIAQCVKFSETNERNET